MLLGKDVYHAIRPLEHFSADEKNALFVVRFPIVWVRSAPFPPSSSLVSTCFKANFQQDYELACQVKSWYDMENCTARTSRLNHDPQPMLARMKYLKQQLFIMAKDTMPVCCGIMTTSSSRLTTFCYWCNLNLSRSGSRETQDWEIVTPKPSVSTLKNVI